MNIADYYQKHPEMQNQAQEAEQQPATPQEPTRPQPAPTEAHRKSHKGLWACVIALLVLILLGVTCPSHEDHRQAVTQAVNEYFNRKAAVEESLFGAAGTLFAGRLVGVMMDELFSTQNYLVFSIGTITELDGDKECVSFGILGHVFTFDADDVAEWVEDV